MDEDKCTQCGTPAAPGAKFCESCGAPLATVSQPMQSTAPAQPAPYTAPVAQAPYAPPGVQEHYQGVAIRFVAILVDAIILGIISYILIAIFAVSAITIDPSTGAVSIGSAYWLVIVLDLIIYFLYYTLLEGHGGQTVGKMAVKIRVVREADGSPIDYGQAAIRTILRIIDAIFVYLIGAILIWSSDKKQRLGDRVAHTVVVRA